MSVGTEDGAVVLRLRHGGSPMATPHKHLPATLEEALARLAAIDPRQARVAVGGDSAGGASISSASL